MCLGNLGMLFWDIINWIPLFHQTVKQLICLDGKAEVRDTTQLTEGVSNSTATTFLNFKLGKAILAWKWINPSVHWEEGLQCKQQQLLCHTEGEASMWWVWGHFLKLAQTALMLLGYQILLPFMDIIHSMFNGSWSHFPSLLSVSHGGKVYRNFLQSIWRQSTNHYHFLLTSFKSHIHVY
jgi:hypothetical protein